MLDGVQKLDVAYDEIWILEDEAGLTPAEKKKFKGKNNILKLYWKNNEVQGCTIAKWYVGNPYSGEKLSRPSHQIVNVYDRAFILKKLSAK